MTDLRRLIVASQNPGKAREIAALLEGLPVEVRSLADWPGVTLPEETGATFEENAALKARAVSRATGEWALADDSGLVVPALGGAPGLRSARVAGSDPERIAWLLGELGSGKWKVESGKWGREAYFVCALALTDPTGKVAGTWEGRVEGQILEAPRGTGGFGYDPVFLYEPAGRSFAEMTREEKAAVSHRGQALRRFRAALAAPALPRRLEAQGEHE
jgi:XTP/dITP diphosphohydrolase